MNLMREMKKNRKCFAALESALEDALRYEKGERVGLRVAKLPAACQVRCGR